jgi:hypothetical protein
VATINGDARCMIERSVIRVNVSGDITCSYDGQCFVILMEIL